VYSVFNYLSAELFSRVAMRARYFTEEIIPTLEENEIEEGERFLSKDIEEELDKSSANIGLTLTHMIDRYDVPLQYEGENPKQYFVEDFEELHESRQEISEELKESENTDEEFTFSQIKQDLTQEHGGQPVDETDLESYLVKRVDMYEDIPMFYMKVERAKNIMEKLEGEVLLEDTDETEVERSYKVSG